MNKKMIAIAAAVLVTAFTAHAQPKSARSLPGLTFDRTGVTCIAHSSSPMNGVGDTITYLNLKSIGDMVAAASPTDPNRRIFLMHTVHGQEYTTAMDLAVALDFVRAVDSCASR